MSNSKQGTPTAENVPVTPPSKRPLTSRAGWHDIAPFAWISLGCFAIGVGLLLLMVWKAEKLVALGLTGNLYYIVLLPLGLSAAGFLFGILRSYARYSGKVLGGVLDLGGPVVVFALVVIGGFFLPAPQTSFAITVFVHGEGGIQDLVLKNSGYVILDLGPDRRKERIGEKGEAYFSGIPANFRGQEVQLWVESEKYEPVGTDQKHRLNGSSLYLVVRRKSGRISGRVQDSNGKPLSGVEIRVAGLTGATDTSGHFEITIPGNLMAEELDLEALASGYAPGRYKAIPNANAMTITLSPAR
jgi:hypothetical protein